MARPKKTGLDYFPLDVEFDDKVKAIEMLHGNNGLVWIIKIWQSAYKTLSGEVNLAGLFGELHAKNCRITTEEHNKILKTSLEIGLFLKLENGFITSNGIKKRIHNVCNERETASIRQLLKDSKDLKDKDLKDKDLKDKKLKDKKKDKEKYKLKETPHYSPNNSLYSPNNPQITTSEMFEPETAGLVCGEEIKNFKAPEQSVDTAGAEQTTLDLSGIELKHAKKSISKQDSEKKQDAISANADGAAIGESGLETGNGTSQGGISPKKAVSVRSIKDDYPWKSDYQIYDRLCRDAANEILFSEKHKADILALYPKCDIEKSLRKSLMYWTTEDKWREQKKKKGDINMVTTLKNNIDKSMIKVEGSNGYDPYRGAIVK